MRELAPLYYITSAGLPTPKASSVQVMQMCAGLATQVPTTLVLPPVPVPQPAASLLRHYDVPASFSVWRLPRRAHAQLWRMHAVRRVHAQQRGAWLCYARGRDVLAAWLALQLGAHAIFEVHGRPVSRLELRLLRSVAAHAHGQLVAISAELAAVYGREYGIPAQRFIIAADAVSLARFTPQLQRAEACIACGLASDARYAVYTGGLYPGRGLEALFAAMRSQSAQLVVVGGGAPAAVQHWRSIASAAGVPDAIFTGYQPPAQIPNYLQAADVLLMPYGARTLTPSGEDTTAFMSPLKMFEYMAAARPIVASDLPALRGTLQHERNALLVAPDEVAPLAAAIARALADSGLAARLAAAARADVAQLSWEARARTVLAGVEYGVQS